MKKILTLLTLALLGITGAWAEEAVLYYAGTGGNSIVVNNFTIAITGNTGKSWGGGNGDISYGGTNYKTLKNSNGAQNTITCPEGKVATKIVFLVTSNADSSGKLSEFDGTTCNDEVTSCKNYTSPTTIEKTIDNKSSFTFTFSTKQVCFIAVVTYEDAVTDKPSLKVQDGKSLRLALTPVTTSASDVFTLTGKNLTDGTYNLSVPSVSGLSVSPTSFTVTSGAVNQEFTVTYTSTVDVAETLVNITATVGELVASVPVTYSARTTYATIAETSAATTWDWTSWSETIELKNDGSTTLSSNDQYTFADIADVCSLTLPSSFDGNKIAFKGQYPVRGKKSQAGTWIIKTTVPGNLEITFSDTGSSGSGVKRYLNINGRNTKFYTQRTGSSSDQKTATVYVPAGEAVITACNEDGDYQAICIYKIVFTPAETLPTTNVTIGALGYRTFASSNPLDFTTPVSGLTAYVAKVNGSDVTFEEVNTTVPAGEGLLLKGAAGEYTINVAATTPNATTNALIGTLVEKTISANSFVLYADDTHTIGFYKTSGDFTVGANTAYLPADVAPARSFIGLFGETTGIDQMENGALKSDGSFYNLNGQRVNAPTKGLYIMNGKKMLVK